MANSLLFVVHLCFLPGLTRSCLGRSCCLSGRTPVSPDSSRCSAQPDGPVPLPLDMGPLELLILSTTYLRRDWRRIRSLDDKYRYLQLCGPDALRTVFRVEISSEVLRDVLTVLEACWLGHGGAAEEVGAGCALREAVFVVQLLQVLAGAFEIGLTVFRSNARIVDSLLLTSNMDVDTVAVGV